MISGICVRRAERIQHPRDRVRVGAGRVAGRGGPARAAAARTRASPAG